VRGPRSTFTHHALACLQGVCSRCAYSCVVSLWHRTSASRKVVVAADLDEDVIECPMRQVRDYSFVGRVGTVVEVLTPPPRTSADVPDSPAKRLRRRRGTSAHKSRSFHHTCTRLRVRMFDVVCSDGDMYQDLRDIVVCGRHALVVIHQGSPPEEVTSSASKRTRSPKKKKHKGTRTHISQLQWKQ